MYYNLNILTIFKTEAPDPSGSTDTTTEDTQRLWTIIDLPEITFKTFHPVRTNVFPQATPVAASSAANTVISNQTTMMVGANNGCGCERHQRTTTESPPSDLITRVIKYRKNMAMYRQTADSAIRRKKKEGKKNKEVREFEDSQDNSQDSAETTTGNDGVDSQENKDTATATANPIEYLTMAIFLRKIPLFYFCIRDVASHHTAAMMMSNNRTMFING